LKSLNIPESVTSVEKNAFQECSSLKSVYYEGSQTISEITAFSNCTSLRNVCVSPDYKSKTFCDKALSTSDACKQFQSMFNQCYKAAFVDGELIELKRMNTTELEERNGECGHFHCNNDTGAIGWSLCNSSGETTRMCYNDSCVEGNGMIDGKVRVVVELDKDVNVLDINAKKILELLWILTSSSAINERTFQRLNASI